MGNKKTEKRLFILILFIMTLLTASYTYAKVYVENHTKDIAYIENEDVVTDEKVIEINEVEELKKKYGNDDIKGKLVIDGTNISEPVVQYGNNDYYLYHNSTGEYDVNGAIFLDHRTGPDAKKVLIFGHSSVYNSIPFNELENYYKKTYYDNHRYITLITETETYKYEIFSVYVETSDFDYMNLKISSETYNNNLKKYKNKSLYETDVEVKDDDEIIILQTCSNSSRYKNYNKKYLLVIGRKVK